MNNNMSIREMQEIMTEEVNVYDFIETLQLLRDNKEHTNINMVVMDSNTNFSSVIHNIAADNITYDEKTDAIHVYSLFHDYTFIIPVTNDVYGFDATSESERSDSITYQFTFWNGELSATFLLSGDTLVREIFDKIIVTTQHPLI